ncbi:MAG: hemolysin-type calcium-binding repeat family protein [Acidimicrobiaceae bacterium]|nr:MAG: hemolysin-type calcium-binding repeat family protein [Acidimicrobiaceae bacterium]
MLTANATNPTTSSAGVFAGQVLALRLNVDFSRAGITKPGLEDLRYQGYSVGQILDAANRALGGDTAILSEMGLTLAQLNAIVDALNRNFDNGTTNLGALACPGPNRQPDAVNDSLVTTKNTAKTISVIANDTDPDGDSLTVTGVTQPAMGSVVQNANGTVKYTPPADWTGSTSFNYTISDGHGGTDTAIVMVMVSNAGCDVSDDDDDSDDDGDSDDDSDDSDSDGDDDDSDAGDDDCDDHDDSDDDNNDDSDHDRDCDREHSRNSRCNDNDGWYRDRHDDRDRSHNHSTNGVCANSSHYRSWYR